MLCKQVLLLALLGGFLVSGLYAQPQSLSESEPLPHPDDDPIHFEHLTNNDGLSQQSLYAIVQDHHGFMWFATQNGLNKYDGYTFTVYHHDPDDDGSLQVGEIRALLEDSQGRLWVGTFRPGGGLSYLDPATETFTRFEHDPTDSTSLSENRVWALLEDKQGQLWVGTQGGGLNRFDPQTETFTRFEHDADDPTSLSHNFVRTILEDRQGTLWIGTRRGGLNRFDPQTETFTRFEHDPEDPTSLSHNGVVELYEDRQGVLWVGTEAGLNRFDPQTETFTRFEHDPEDPTSLLNAWVMALEEDSRGILWVGMGNDEGSGTGGLSRFDRATESFIHYRHDPLAPGSLNSNMVLSMLSDRQGVLWVGGRGLSRVDRSAQRFGLYRTDGRDSYGLNWGSSFTLYEDHTGVLWVYRPGDGAISAFNRSTGALTVYEHDPSDPRSIGPGWTWTMVEDHTGTMWLGNQWLNRLDRATGTFTSYQHDPDDPNSIGPGNISCLYVDQQGGLWIGHGGSGGLDRMDLATGTFQHYRHDPQDTTSLGAGNVLTIYEAEDGVFWLTIGERLSRFDPATGRFRLVSDVPGGRIITERSDEPGILWTALNGGQGLVRFDTRSQTWSRYTMQNSGLPNNRVYGVLPDEAGYLWLSTEGGISRFNPDTGVFKNYDVDDGLQDKEFNIQSFHKSPSGEMFFGGVKGINYFFPDQIVDNTNPPEVVLTAFRLFNEVQHPGPDSPLSVPLADTDALSLAYNQNDVSFEYVGLHYQKPEKNQYAYLLEGYDADWQEAGTLRRVNYTNLPPGTYTFRIKASNSDGVWNEEGASVRLVIAPPWWRTTWAYLLYGLLFVAAVFAVDRVQRRRLIARERERTRERELEQAREIEKAYHELRQTKDRLVQQEKMASLGQLTAGIAHEIKNPLNFVNNFSEIVVELTDELNDELDRDATLSDVGDDFRMILADLRQNARVINQHGKRADGIVHAMMQHASGGTGQRESVDINHLVSEHIDLAYHGKRAQMPDLKVEIERDLGEEAGEVEVVPQEIGRVLLNLLSNAFDAVREHALKVNGDYEPTVAVSTRRNGETVEIRIADNGLGIDKNLREKIFEPFFTTKPTGSGTGLGLSLSYDIVTHGHGGTLTFESEEGRGTTFAVSLPTHSSG